MKNFKTKDYIFAGAFAAIFIVFIVVMMTVMRVLIPSPN